MRYILLFYLILAGCAQEAAKPDDLLDRETFISILTEAQLIEARMNHEMVVEHRTAVPMGEYYEEVFTDHNTNKEQFQRTFEYYSERPEELKAIYEEVITELGRRKDREK